MGGRRIPDSDRVIVISCCQHRTVVAERNPMNPPAVDRQCHNLLPVIGSPELDGSVEASRCDAIPVRAVNDLIPLLDVAPPIEDLFLRIHVPDC